MHPHNTVPVVRTVDSNHSGVPTGVPSAKPSTQPTERYVPVLVPRQRVKPSASLVTKQQQPLRPCRKQHVSVTSQSRQYRHSLPNGSRVSFGIITLPRQRPQTHQHHAYRAQNTIIDSYKVAMEVHEQHKYTAINSGASGNFYPENYEGERHDTTADTIRVGCANKGVMESLAEDIIYFNKLPLEAKKCHKFKEI